MVARKGKPRNATPLDRFLPVDFQCLQRVAENGRLDIEFETDNMANNTKMRLFRLRESLQVYQPGDTLAKASRYFTFKVRSNVVTIVDRVRSSEVQSQNAALLKAPQISADPQEIFVDESIFDNIEGEGNDEASKG